MWLGKWNTSIIFSTFSHSLSYGTGSGKGFLATFILSKLHMLSYARVVAGNFKGPPHSFASDTNHWIKIKRTWDGDSDLTMNANYYDGTDLVRTYMYSGCHASMCPPPLTINWWPLDHFLSLSRLPISFRHSSPSLVKSSLWTMCFTNSSVPKNLMMWSVAN